MVACVADTERLTRNTYDMSQRNSVVSLEAMTLEMIDLVEAEVGPVDVTADTTLLNCGLDSLQIMSLVFKIEERYGIVLDDEDADDLRTVGDLAALAVRHIQEKP